MMGIMVYGIVLAVLAASVLGGLAKCTHDIKMSQKAEDQAAITAAQGNTAICKDANASLLKSIEPIKKERDEQNKKVEDLDTLWREAGAIALAWRGKYYGLQAKNAQGQLDAHAKGLRPTDPAMTCQQILGEMDADGRQFAIEREARMREVLGLPAKPDEPAPKVRVGK